MKGIQGLVMAVVLGILGAVVNLYYLNKSSDTDVERFVGIREGVSIARGTRLTREHLEPVEIPSTSAKRLKTYAFLYKDIDSVVGERALRDYSGRRGEIILRQDLRTPPPALTLKANEAAIGVIVNSATTLTSQIVPGVTPVSFYLPVDRGSGEGAWDWFGSFDVLAVGSRLGTSDTMRAHNISAQQRNVLTLRVKYSDGKIDKKIAELKDYLRRTANPPLEVMIHPPVKTNIDKN
jgi:hypothetical protein